MALIRGAIGSEEKQPRPALHRFDGRPWRRFGESCGRTNDSIAVIQIIQVACEAGAKGRRQCAANIVS